MTMQDVTSNEANATNGPTSSFLPPIFNIQYPNCQRGMFSLRSPFRNTKSEILSASKQRPEPTRTITPNVAQPKLLHMDRALSTQTRDIQPMRPPISQRHAQVQCSLLMPTVRHEMAVQTRPNRQRTFLTHSEDDELSPRYRVNVKLRPVQQHPSAYEVWSLESPPPRKIPMNQPARRKDPPTLHVRSPRLVNIKPITDDEYETDYDDERILYARVPRKLPKKTYLPPNVRMICVRQDANTVSY